MQRNAVRSCQALVQLVLLQLCQLVGQLLIVHLREYDIVSIQNEDVMSERTSIPIPTGFEMASEISLVSSICSLTASIVASTASTLLEQRRVSKCDSGMQ